MTRRGSTALAVLLAFGALVTGCDDDGGGRQPAAVITARPDLVARADLDACPDSSPESVDDGLPDLTLPCLGEGPAVHLAGLTGTPTVLNIWAAWCRPCQAETPILSRAYADLGPRVRVLGVDTVDDPNNALDFAVNIKPRMQYPSVVDDDKRVLIAIGGTTGPPLTVFVDADGKIVGRKFGEYRSDQQLRDDIEKYLGVSS